MRAFYPFFLALFAWVSLAQADTFGESICALVQSNYTAKSWHRSLNDADERSKLFHDTSEIGLIDLSRMKNFVARHRDGFALRYIFTKTLFPQTPLFIKLMEFYRTADVKQDLRYMNAQELAAVETEFPFFESPIFNKNYEELRSARQNAAYVAEPVVEFLLAQRPGSVTAVQLMRKATEFYAGDVLTAYGVIAFLFYEEAKGTKVRPYHQVLAGRMKPQLASFDDVGMNYHFWTYLSLGLQGHRLLGGSASFFLETIRQRDVAENKADLLGLEAGLSLRNCL